MNYIKIDESSRILLEDSNYTLEYRVKSGIQPGGKKATKEFRWIIGGYFPSLDSLLQDWVCNAPARQNAGVLKSLQDVAKCIQDAEAHIAKLIHNNHKK